MSTAGRDSRGDAVRIHGLKETVKRLEAFDAGLVKEVKVIEREAMTPVLLAARAAAPVGQDKHPGRLAASGRISALKFSAKVSFGSNAVPYAGPIHFGWGARHIKANKFLYRAFDAAKPEMVHLFNHSVEALVERVKG